MVAGNCLQFTLAKGPPVKTPAPILATALLALPATCLAISPKMLEYAQNTVFLGIAMMFFGFLEAIANGVGKGVLILVVGGFLMIFASKIFWLF